MNMQIRIRSRLTDSAGFTLIELMVVVVIASVLIAIAIPSYISSARKSRRTEAKTALLDLAGREERYFDTSSPPVYTAVPSQLGYGAAAFPVTVGSGYYSVTLILTTVAGVPGYTITATPVVGNNQAKDIQCTSFQLTSTGIQTSAPNTTACWQ
jgi:type IV pilus assembly protein PilE